MYMEHGGTSKRWVWHTILHLDVVFFLFAGSVKSFGCVRSLGDRTRNITNTIFKRRDWMVEPIWGSILAELVLICSSCVHDSFQTTFKIQRAPLSHTISDVSHETPLKSWRHGPDHCRDSLLLAFWTTCVFASTNETKLQIFKTVKYSTEFLNVMNLTPTWYLDALESLIPRSDLNKVEICMRFAVQLPALSSIR